METLLSIVFVIGVIWAIGTLSVDRTSGAYIESNMQQKSNDLYVRKPSSLSMQEIGEFAKTQSRALFENFEMEAWDNLDKNKLLMGGYYLISNNPFLIELSLLPTDNIEKRMENLEISTASVIAQEIIKQNDYPFFNQLRFA